MNQRTAPDDPDWLDAASAAAFLSVKRETLYAYASRGEIRTRPVSGSRARRYAREDLVRLKTKSAARAGHGPVAAGALQWGEPVLDTRVSAIDPVLGPAYRGRPAIELAATETFESVAALLWDAPSLEPWRTTLGDAHRRAIESRARPLERLALLVPMLALDDPDRFVTSEAVELERARALILSCVAALSENLTAAKRALAAGSVARALAIAVGASARSVRSVERALILSADHELNVSTFCARIVASSGADLYACTSAAIAAMSGPAHGGMSDRVDAFLAELDRPEHAARLVRERLARGDPLVGFGHPLYPSGDPRTGPLLDDAARLAPRSPVVRKALALRDSVRLAGAGEPTIDYGLVAIAAAAGFPPGHAVAIFTIGRTAGWIAHVREQRTAGALLRPRARYVGPAA